MRRRWNSDDEDAVIDDWRAMLNRPATPAKRPTPAPTAPPPGFKPVSQLPSRPTLSVPGSKFATHTADEITVGMTIEHQRFGQGVVTNIDTTGADAKIHVDFPGLGSKTLLLKFAKISLG